MDRNFCERVQVLCDFEQPIKEQQYTDQWNGDYVRMPFSGQSKYPVGDKVTSRWSLVKKALSQELLCVEDLEEAILSYNPRFKKSWSFRLLKAFFIEEATLEERVTFFDETLPNMQEICLSAEKYFPEPPRLLKKRSNREIYLSQHQASILMIMAFFCLYPRRNSSRADAEYGAYNFINFNKLFGLPTSNHSNFEKLRTLLNYFHRVSKSPPTGVVSFHRVEADFMPLWDMEEKKLTRVKFDDDGLIDQEGSKYIEMDFANKYIGGGVLGHGLVQEEIRFIVAPEFIVTLLLTEELSDDECLGISNRLFPGIVIFNFSNDWM